MSECCHHRIGEELRGLAVGEGNLLDSLETAIEREIDEAQVELRDAVQELMECEEIKLAHPSDQQLIKLRNTLDLQLIS